MMGKSSCLFVWGRNVYLCKRLKLNCLKQISQTYSALSRPHLYKLQQPLAALPVIGCRSFPLSTTQQKTNYFPKFEQTKDYLNMSCLEGNIQLSWLWLRDHCRCEICYNHETNQKNILTDPTTASPSPFQPADVMFDEEEESVKITWKNGHKSEYGIGWLQDNSYSQTKKPAAVEKFLWTRDQMNHEPLPTVEYADHIGSEAGLRQSLENMVKYGFTIVQGASPTLEDTERVSERMGKIMDTCFGHIWSFTADMKHADTAYSNASIGPHTDTTYMTHPAGVQVFHCLQHDGEGGQTMLVDGIQVANRFKQDYPDSFDYLTRATVAHAFIDAKNRDYYYSLGQILSLSPVTKQLRSIRFNMYDIAPLSTIPPEETNMFYTAYNKLKKSLFHKDNQLLLKLKPGMVLFVDNWRLLHGRTGFTGKREVCGCYIGQDELENSYRRYDLL